MILTIPADDSLVSHEIVICDVCSGRGISARSELVDYHRGEYDRWNVFCTHCGGEGRMLLIKACTQVTQQLANGDSKVHNLTHHYLEPLNGRKTQDIYKVGRDE